MLPYNVVSFEYDSLEFDERKKLIYRIYNQ